MKNKKAKIVPRFNSGDGVYHPEFGVGVISCHWGTWTENEQLYGVTFDNNTNKFEICSQTELESRPNRKRVTMLDARPRSKEAKEAYRKDLQDFMNRA